MMSKENYKQLLEVAEMSRDQNKNAKGSPAYMMADTAIKNFYKEHLCPHRLREIKVIKAPAGGCETTAEFCFDCGKQLTLPETDC